MAQHFQKGNLLSPLERDLDIIPILHHPYFVLKTILLHYRGKQILNLSSLIHKIGRSSVQNEITCLRVFYTFTESLYYLGSFQLQVIETQLKLAKKVSGVN